MMAFIVEMRFTNWLMKFEVTNFSLNTGMSAWPPIAGVRQAQTSF